MEQGGLTSVVPNPRLRTGTGGRTTVNLKARSPPPYYPAKQERKRAGGGGGHTIQDCDNELVHESLLKRNSHHAAAGPHAQTFVWRTCMG